MKIPSHLKVTPRHLEYRTCKNHSGSGYGRGHGRNNVTGNGRGYGRGNNRRNNNYQNEYYNNNRSNNTPTSGNNPHTQHSQHYSNGNSHTKKWYKKHNDTTLNRQNLDDVSRDIKDEVSMNIQRRV